MVETSEDEELMALYSGGEEQAFRELYERYKRRVYGFVLKRVRDPRIAEELFQTTFLKLHRSRARYKAGQLFSAWCFAICTNVVRDHFRKEKKKGVEISLDEAHGVEKDKALGAPEGKILLEEVLSSLSEKQRNAISLRCAGNMEFERIAGVLGTSEANTRQLISRAMRTIKAKFAR